jgi:hypothetical protein
MEQKLYVHSKEWVEPRVVETRPDSTVKEIGDIVVAQGGIGGPVEGEILVFIEEQDEPLGHHQTLAECEVRHKHHLHIHHCKKVKVGVFYNAERHEHFAPSAKVKKVLKWAIHAFKLTPAEAMDKVLVLKSHPDTELNPDAHIGSYAERHHCVVELCLVAPVEVNG